MPPQLTDSIEKKAKSFEIITQICTILTMIERLIPIKNEDKIMATRYIMIINDFLNLLIDIINNLDTNHLNYKYIKEYNNIIYLVKNLFQKFDELFESSLHELVDEKILANLLKTVEKLSLIQIDLLFKTNKEFSDDFSGNT
jgi:hypothetical protein